MAGSKRPLAKSDDRGLYAATSVARLLLTNLPRILLGENPHSSFGRLAVWGAPLMANMLGMFVNLQMRSDISGDRQWTDAMERRIEGIENRVGMPPTQAIV